MTIRERYDRVLEWFEANGPSPKTELNYETPFQLLVAVILSAQCTDKRVNIVTPPLFEAYPDPSSMAAATEEELFPYIKSISFPNNKTRHLLRAARMLVDDFGGEIPSDLESLLKLPGVGRKTANVMLAVVWHRATMAVDTHVFRVSNRLGLTRNSKNPLQTEKTLMKYIPEEKIPDAHHWLLLHGRYVCKAQRPDCLNCGLCDVCLHFQSIRN